MKPGEFILGYPDETGQTPALPQPEVLSRNGSFMAYRRMQQHVGLWRDYLREHADTRRRAGIVGWRSSWAAGKAVPRWSSPRNEMIRSWGQTPCATTTSTTAEMDPHGYAVPLGSHVRRLNPRDTAASMNRHRMIRRGATYGPGLPEDAPDDGVERGIAAFIICASLVRQFEFAQNVWINDKSFHQLGNERDPIVGDQDGTLDYTIPDRPIRKVLKGLPAFTTTTGGAYFFMPGLNALRYLTTLTN